jgi:hypothetical protein
VHRISQAVSSLFPTGFDYNGVTVVGLAVLVLILAAGGVVWFRPQVNRALKDKDARLAREKEISDDRLSREKEISDNLQKAFENSEKARLEQGEQLEKLVAGMSVLDDFIRGLSRAGSKSDRTERR